VKLHAPELTTKQPLAGGATGTHRTGTPAVTIIGDQLITTSKAALKHAIPGVQIYATAGKHTDTHATTALGGYSGLELLTQRRQTLKETVVLALGTNDAVDSTTYGDWIDSAMDQIGSQRHAVLVTVSNNSAINTAIRAARARHPRLSLADWHAVERVTGDGTTPTAAGAKILARAIAAQVKKVATPSATATAATRQQTRQPGIPLTANLRVKTDKASRAKIQTMNAVLAAAYAAKATPRALLTLVAAVIVECEFINLQTPDSYGSIGVIQNIPGTSSGIRGTFTRSQALDIAYCVRSVLSHSPTSFENTSGGGLNGAARRHPDWSIGRVAANVINGSVNATQGVPAYVNEVNKWKNQAEAIIAAYGAGATASTSTTSAKYEFARGQTGTKEDSWTCIQRLAEEVHWRAFVVADTVYFISDDELLASQPHTTITEQTPGIAEINFDLDVGKSADQATVTARTARWTAPPGTVIEIENSGPANGRWLVAAINRSLFSPDADITLERPQQKLLEPKGESSTDTKTSAPASTNTVPANVLRAYRAAAAMDAKHLPYVWGGGHGRAGTPSGGGYDCSGSTTAILAAAGMGYRVGGSVPVSGTMTSWGKPGRGKYITLYANAEHVWLYFDVPGKRGHHFGTGDWGKGWKGPGFNPRAHPTANFTARHWTGT
jgi:cell wall-associated NlpC family hydrolase/lysophospholipase L1-like esterase